MIRSWPLFTALAVLSAISGCAGHKPPKLATATPLRNGSLTFTAGIEVAASADLPADFAADPAYAPVWLDHGAEIAVAGRTNRKTIVLGFGGPGWAIQHVIAEDFGVGAPRGKLLDLAAAPDGLTVATAVAEPAEQRLEVIVRGTVSDSADRPMASFAGVYDWAQLKWLNDSTIALALRTNPPGGASDDAGVVSLHLITVAGQPTTKAFDHLACGLSPLSYSIDTRMAVAQGSRGAAPALLDLRDGTCRALPLREPIRVLAWAPDSSSFLYMAQGDGRVAGVFRYDLSRGVARVVAIASAAAAYASDGAVVAVGNRTLSWRRAAAAPDQQVTAEIALTPAGQSTTTINSLGFATSPAMLAESSMVFSENSDRGVIDITIPVAAAPLRELIEYSYPTRAAFV
ncbi:MAG: hypothetical protein ACREQC_15095, partial [Candidatus Binataceae bacterium]